MSMVDAGLPPRRGRPIGSSKCVASSPLIRALRAARIDKRISQTTLGERMGVSKERLCAWEIGRQGPLLKDLERWVDALGLEIELMDKIEVGR
ncbi:MAG TPA: helix-turn-helix transcriptional regulator [Rhizomicrobium sp.]|nr:helix-turn-helix transcriptional regulator [Rhizomicrobium sp.]